MSRLEAVRNDRVEFVTRRPPGSPFAALEREVVVTGPPELREVDAFATRPGECWDALGGGAQERWREWLADMEEA